MSFTLNLLKHSPVHAQVVASAAKGSATFASTPPAEKFRVVFAGGGTGGHLAPGIAMADELLRRVPSEATFCVTGKAVEGKMFGPIPVHRETVFAAPPSKSPVAFAKFVVLTILGFFKAWKLLRERKPHVVVALGGYGALPVALAARLQKIPLVVCEQNTVAGRATRFLSRWATTCLTQWPLPDYALHQRCRQVVIGNPVRRAIFDGRREIALKQLDLRPDRRTVLVMGGSQGAEPINRWLVSNRRVIASNAAYAQVIVIAGARNFDEVSQAFKHMANVRVVAFASNIGDLLAAADLVVGRAGATSIAECTALGKPMVLIPFPQAKDGHQLQNALYLARNGAAVVFEQEFLDEEKWKVIFEAVLMNDWERYAMADASAMLGRPQAAELAVTQVVQAAGFRTTGTTPMARDDSPEQRREFPTFDLTKLKVEGVLIGEADHPAEFSTALDVSDRRDPSSTTTTTAAA